VKPSPFVYHRPEGLEEALAVLAEVGADGKVLAGGQSLLPILSMRLAAPGHLVDVNRLSELAYVRAEPDGVRVGALARHAAVERDEAAGRAQPLLRQALRHVAHPTIRNRGTTVGSLAHADPSGEMTAVLAVLAGSVTLASASGRRDVPAADFFLGPLESAVGAGELAVEAFFPAAAAGAGTAFVEVARRHGDYAVCGVAAVVTPPDAAGNGAGRAVRVRLGFVSMGPTPSVADLAEVAPAGPGGDPRSWADAAAQAVAGLEPEGDIHATAAYRLHLARVLGARALASAWSVSAAGRGEAAA
jgi:aerobic carbon-monoxide dehydrogenase medium subunit